MNNIAREIRALRIGRMVDREFTFVCSRFKLDPDLALLAPVASIAVAQMDAVSPPPRRAP